MSNPKRQISNVRGERGFTLVETMIALFVLTVGIVGVFVFLNQTFTATPDPIGRLEALYLAQEGVEIVRNIRDANFAKIVDAQEDVNWLDGLGNCGSGCEADYLSDELETYQGRQLYRNSEGFYDYSESGEETSFQRKITVVKDSSNPKADVVVEVTWEIRGMPRSVSVSTQMYDWLE